jgi:hypothetical protein
MHGAVDFDANIEWRRDLEKVKVTEHCQLEVLFFADYPSVLHFHVVVKVNTVASVLRSVLAQLQYYGTV